MKKQYLSTVLKSLLCAAIIAGQAFTASATDWLYGCGENMTVELEYTGINNNVPSSLSFANPGNIDHVVAEIVYKGCNPGSSITIQDASNNSYTAYRVQPSGTSSNVWVYRTTIPATASISYSNQYNESCAQSLVAYVFRQQVNAGQTAGTFTGRSGYNDVQTVTIPIPTDAAARDITLYVPMSEMTTDGRYIYLGANAGGVTASVSERIWSSSLPNGCCIKVFELQLNNVPANTNTVTLTIDTRHNVHESANGQSWVLAAAVYTDIECVGCDADITEIALHDLGSNTNTTLVDGATYTLASLPTNWNVEALVSGSTVGSVKFTWSGDYSATNTENSYPYRTPTDEAALNLGAGSYTLNVKTYTQSGCGGSLCDEVTIHFTITGCDNVTDAGEIGYAQSGCSPFDPAEIVSVEDPSGGSGDLEFVWLKSYNGGSSYSMISGANGLTYDPGSITQTAWYRRCARRAGCTQYVGESNWVKMTVGVSGVTVNVTGTDVSCDADTVGQCQAVDYQNGSHAVWINTLPNTGQYFRFENNSGSLVEYPDGTARVTGIVYNTNETNKRWQVDVYLTDKMNWTQWQAAGGSWKGTSSIVGNNYEDWAYYEMDASQSKLIGLGYYAGKELSLQRMAAAPQFRVQVGTAANDKNGNYGLSLWFDYAGDFCSSGHGDFNFDLQNCVDLGCDGAATATASGGTAPYTYVWDNGGASSTLSGLCAGQYCVTVTDANGCTSDEVCVTIGQQTPCCDNITDGGEIAEDQSNCGPFDVAELTSVSDPSGGTGAMEIVWITRPGTSGTWQMIAGANGLTYDPGVVSTTTQYRRCARREGCTDYIGESNIITVTVYPSFTLECNSSDASAWEATDGTVGILVNGGIAPYTYLWNTGATSASVSNVPAGVYSVTVTDANGCQVFAECCVKQPPMPQVCIGFRTQTPGGWGATPNGGNPGAYLHANFATAFPSGIEIGCTNKFRFTTAQSITDFLPCGGTATGLPAGIATNPSCPGNVLAGHVLAATISVGFDNAIASFSTSTVPLENLIVRTGTFQGWTVGDLLEEANRKLGGCSSGYSYSQLVEGVSSVNENYVDGNVTGNYLDCCSLTVSCQSTNGTCVNPSAAGASVNVSGGTAPYTYSWSNGATTSSISGVAEGSYSVTVSDATGCEATCSVSVYVEPQPETEIELVVGECATVNEMFEAALGFNVFVKEGVTLSTNETDGAIAFGGNLTLDGSYTIGGSSTGSFVDNGDASASALVVGGRVYYTSGSGINVVNGGFVKICDLTGSNVHDWDTQNNQAQNTRISAGGYNDNPMISLSVHQSEASINNCSIDFAEAFTRLNATAQGLSQCENNVTLVADQGVSYRKTVQLASGKNVLNLTWSELSAISEFVFSNAPDASSSLLINVDNSSSPSATWSIPNMAGLGDSHGRYIVWNFYNATQLTLTGGGTLKGSVLAPNAAVIDNNSGNIDGQLIAKSWDHNGGEMHNYLYGGNLSGCQEECTEEITDTLYVCDGGTVKLRAQSGASYVWSNGETTQEIEVGEGTYSVTVYDVNGCGAADTAFVVEYPELEIDLTVDQPVCEGETGSITATVSGGTAPYQYEWSNGQTTASISGLQPGVYSVEVTDAKGCVATEDAEVVEASGMSVSCSSVNGNCGNGNQASASVSVSGGTAPYTYAWSNGATTASISGLAEGSYSVTVTDANGCEDNCSVTVTTVPCCNVTNPGSIAGTQENCGPFDPAAFTSVAPATGGLGVVEYQWYEKETETSWTPIPGANGETYDPPYTTVNKQFKRCAKRASCPEFEQCSNVLEITIYPDNISATCTPTSVACAGESTGTASVAVQGGTAPYSYAWSNGGTSETITGLAAGLYSVTVTDQNGCTGDCFVLIGEPNSLVATCSKVDGDCTNGNAASASVSASGGTAPYTYAWSNGGTTASISGLTAGSYSVTITDANGCTDNCSVSVTTTPCCNVTDPGEIAANQNNCGSFDPVEITSVSAPSGGLGALEIVWITRPGTSGSWTEIPGATGLSYDPGVITQTTQFRRCARRAGCTDYIGESNIITITVYPNDMVANCSSDDVDCNGASTGSASVSVTDGTAPYTVLWSTGATTMSISNLMAGSYSVTVTDANGCTTTCTAEVDEPSDLSVNCSKVDGTCSNNNQPSASVSASGGTAPYSYAWSNGATTASISDLAAGTYSVTVTDANGCTDNCSVTVSITPCCNVNSGGTIAGGQENCGPFDPAPITSASLPTGGLGDLEYVWLWNTQNVPNNGNSGWVEIPNSNSATYDPSMLTETRCFLRCARRSGCTTYVGESNIICFTINPDDMVATCTPTDADCNGASTGSVSVAVTGGTAPYTVLWSTGATTMSVSNLMAGSYSVTVTDANGCTTTCSAQVDEPSDLTATCAKVDGTCSNNNQASVSVTAAGGTAPYTYLWSNGSTASSISGLAAGTYSVTVTDANGCTETCSKTVTITPCCNVTNGGQIAGGGSNCGPFDPAPITSASLPTGGLGDLEYVWLWNTQNVVNNGNSGWVEIPNSNSATYDPGMLTETRCFLRCARRSGCTTYIGESNIICFTVNPEPTASCSKVDGTCANGNQASASVSISGGTAPYTYLWSNGATTASISGLADGTYSVTVTDVNGCSDDCSVTVSTVPCCNVTDPGTVAGNQSNCGPFDPVAFTSVAPATGGLGDIVYQWYSKETETAWMPIAGANGETYDPGMISVNTQFKRCAKRTSCPEFEQCSNVLEITIYPDNIIATCTPSPVDCNGGSTGSVSVAVQGGTAPYTYAWSNGGTSATITGLAAGSYGVTITDANGCTSDCSAMVTEPSTLTASCSGDDVDCYGESTGEVSVSAAGGTTPYTYLWSNGATTASVENLPAGTYSVTVTDANGCTATCSHEVDQPQAPLSLNCNADDADCNGASTGSASVTASGGHGPYTYAWSNGATTASISGLAAGSYSVTVTDHKGCTETCNVTVGEPSQLTATCGGEDIDCYGESTGEVSVSATGGTAPYTYLWSNGATTASVDNLPAGTYSVTVTDANGCTATCSKEVEQPQVPVSLNCSADDADCNGASTGSASVSATGGTAPYAYLWSNGATTASVNGLAAGSYSVTVTDSKGCEENCSVTVGEPSAVAATCSSTNGTCTNNNVASASVSAAGGTAPYTYLWSNGATTASISNLADGTYSVTVTDANGCSDDCSVNVSTTPCCDVTDPGTVAGSQEGCGPFDPVAFTSVAPATGGLGNIVYQWYQKETETAWMPIPGANGETYDPGMIYVNSQFRRCARREGCPEFVFCSNVLEIEIHPIPQVNCTSVSGNCSNGNGASASVNVQGGTSTYTFAWSNGGTTQTISDLAEGTYSVTVTDYFGCSATCSVNVTVEGCCNVTDGGQIAGGQENCGPFDPAAITSVAPATGGIGPVEYVWLWNSQNVPVNNGNNGWAEIANSNSETFDPGMLTETRCYIRCARNVGCTTYIGESNVICMVVNPVPVATCTPVNGDCNNNNSASASVSVSGGTSPYSYLWSNGATTASISGLTDGTYSVTVTDINGCSDDCSVTVTTNPCCDVTEPGEVAGSQSGCGAFDPVAFTSIAPATGGLGGIEYQWYQKETETAWMPIPGATGETYDPGMISVNSQFRRCARRTGCPEFEVCSNVLEIEIYPVPNAFCTKEDGNCNNGNQGSVSVTAQGGTGPYTYLWSNGATTASINGLAAGTYSVTVTDQNGCTATCSKTVSVNPCCNVTDGGDIAGGQENCGPFDPAAITSIAPATGGLGNLEYIWLMNDENVPLNNGQNGWVEIPGSNSETYDPGMITETTCFIRCARREGCTTYVGESNVICMVVNDSPVASCSSTDSGCNGSGTGTATVTATGGEAPYTYAWSNGGTTATISGLMAGSYSVTVTDANGCTDVCTAVVGEPSGLSATCDATDATCNGENNGSLSVNATGGSAPYTYLWSNGATTATVDNVGAGSYSVTVTDANGCTATCSSTVSEPSALSASCSKVDGDCQNNNQGSASVSVSGGVEPYTVLWSTGATTMNISNQMAGSYSVTVTDANGCEATCSVIVENTPCCNVTDGGEIAGGQSNCGPFDPAAITSVAPATGGIGPVEYVWLWNANNVPLNNGQNGWVEIPNSNSETFDPGMLTESRCFIRCARNQGCVPYIGESNVVCITIYPQPVATCTPDNGSCNNGNVSSASVSVSGGTEPYTYAWSNGATTASISNLADGTYSVTVTDANGCSDDCSVTVSSTPCCNVTDGGEIAGTQENCGPFDPAALTSVAPATGGIGPVEYVWLWNSQNVPINNGQNGWVEIPNSNSETFDPGMLTESRCFIRCARNQGCEPYIGESNVVCITINEAPVVSCTSTSGDCNNGNTASASVSVTGGEAPYSYLWSNGATTATIDSLATGTYSVTVTDANGCEASCSTSVQLTGCCNVTDPGEIGYNQQNCGPFDADELVSLADPTGGLGNLEIVWITRPGTSGVWQLIPGANGLTYDPGLITTTTQFRRCVQREGCSEMEETSIITITIFPQPEVVCNPTHGDCSNNGVGAVSTSITGGTAPFTYVWSTGATTADISGLGEGTYSVTVTDANGCTTECSVEVMSEPCCNVTDGGEINNAQENCGPFDPAEITSLAPATGGIGPVEYLWLWNPNNVPVNNGNNGWVMIPNSNSETYDPGYLTESRCFIRCARNVGCENFIGESNVVCITVNPVPEVLCTKQDGDCANGRIASVTATASNGTEPYTYLWSNGETTATIDSLEAGTYTVTITDANGCEATCSKTVSVVECCNVTDGGEIAEDQENCGPFDPAEITSVAPATGGIGPVEYLWLWNDENVPMNNGQNGWVEIPNSNSETYDPGMLTESRCFIRCARNQGCETYIGESNVVCITIFEEPVATCTPTNGDCNNGNVSSASVSVSGGTAPYTYAWSNGETTASITNLADGTYSVTVTDANGCTDDCSVTVEGTPCCNVTDGGEIAEDQENCGPFDPAEITSLAPATGGIGPVEYLWLWNDENVPMNNGNNGWVEIPNSNSETYDPGMLTESRCFIRCARNEGCEDYIGESNVVCITIFPELEIECSSISGDCGNGNAASASVEVLNGTEPYTYEWSNGETTAEITDLEEGTYTVTVTDANGCTATCTESVIVTPCCNVTDPGEIAADQSNCTAFDPDPIVSIAPATGGIGPVEYMWLSGDCNTPVNTWAAIPGANGESYDPGMITETTCFIRCARNNGCEPWIGESNVITITIQNALTIECSSISGDCGNGNAASATVDVIDGTAPFTFEWSNGETTQTIENLAEGTYTVTVTDANGCTATCTESVIVTPCCNVTDPGEIAANQENCGPFDPDPIVSIAPATGGIGPVEYMWLSGDCSTPVNTWAPIPGANGESYDPGMITETTCFVRCARNNGCEPWIGESNIITITVYPAIELTCNGVDGDCTNGNVARAIAHVSGGTEPYSVMWSNGETEVMIDSLEAGTYTVTVTDANGCEATCTTSVSVTPCCNVTDGGEIAESQENCGPFDPDPIVSVTPATGGIGPVEYAWYSGPCPGNDPTFGQTAIPAGFTLIAGATGESYDPGLVEETTCYIRVARNQGCEEWIGESNIVSITVNPNPVAQCTSENGTCENGNVGSASVTVSGGPSPFTYAWSTGETTASISNLAEGTYSVVVTDGNGCVDSCSTAVEVVPCCNVTDGGEIAESQENCGPFDAEEIVSVTPATGGIGPVEYAWYSGPCPGNDPTIGAPVEGAIPQGFTLIAGATGESYDPGLVEETTCYIRVARNQGCTDWIGESNIVSIIINAGPVVQCTSENGNCENGNVGSASVNVTTGESPFTYAWSNGGTGASISQLEPGTYSVIVTDANGCVDSCSVEVENEGCCNVTDGGEINGSQENCGPFDASEITSVAPATGGIGPVEYAWYSGPCPGNDPTIGAPNMEAIPAGFTLIAGATGESYDPGVVEETTCYIRVARNQGCTDWLGESNIVTITIFAVPEVDVAVSGGVNPSCSGETVELTAQASSSVSYEWSTGATSSSIEVSEEGTYVVTVWDVNGCSATDSIDVELYEEPEVEIEITGTTPFCEGDSVLLTAVCETAAGYSWSTGATGSSIWVTEAGTYEVEVVDTNGCTASTGEKVEVFELPEVEITIDGNNPLCDGDSALLTAVSQGAIGYEWSNGATTQSIWVYEAGTYMVTVVDEGGCENSTSIEIEEGLTPLIEITGDTIACAGSEIALTAQYAGGEGVLWSTGATTQTIVVTEAGEYCASTTSIDGCEASACISIDFYPTPEVAVEVTAGNNPLCPGGQVELTAVSQNAVSYVWSTQETSSSITVTEVGTYSVEITDANGCTSEGSIEVEEGLVPLIEITGETEFCTGDSVMLTAQYAGGEGVTWSTGETAQSIWVSEEGQYCVTTASIDGCEAQACIEVEEAAIPEVYAGPDINICEGDETMLTATGGTSGTTYTWYVDGEEVGTGATIIVSPEVGITEYTVVAVNENCSISDEDHIKVYVYDYPLAGFERDPAGDVPFGSDIQFTDTTLGNVTDWHWDFGDGMTSMLQNPDHNYEDPGSYWVTLIASNNGCADTAVGGLEVKIIIDIPNVFTPNNDGVNDVIWLQGTDLDNISMTIFNRWGHSVYASEGRQFSWSGKTSAGVDCEAGTYYYVIEMKYKDGNVSEQTGFVTLIRQ